MPPSPPGPQRATTVRDSGRRRNALGDLHVVTGEQCDGQALRPEPSHRFRGVGANSVTQPDPVLASHRHCGGRLNQGRPLASCHSYAVHEAMYTHTHLFSHLLPARQRDIAADRLVDDGPGDRVRTVPLQAGRDPQGPTVGLEHRHGAGR